MNQQPEIVRPQHSHPQHNHLHHCHPHHHLRPPNAHSHQKVKRTSNLSTCSEVSGASVPYSNCSTSTSTIQKEQYWMCSKRTKLEKLLMLAVMLLSVVIIGMTIGLAVLASGDRQSQLYRFVMAVFGPLGRLHQSPVPLTISTH